MSMEVNLDLVPEDGLFGGPKTRQKKMNCRCDLQFLYCVRFTLSRNPSTPLKCDVKVRVTERINQISSTVIRRLTTGIPDEKCVVRRLRRCTKVFLLKLR
jgi:hypothetical protein